MSRFAIFGCGGFGRELLQPARDALARSGSGGEVVFVADEPHGAVLDTQVLHPDMLEADDEMIVAIGSPEARRTVAERLAHVRAGTLIAPNAIIGPGVSIDEGAVFCAYTMVTASARIGRHFQCNIYSYVAHDCVIGDFVTFAPRVSCNGNVHIGDGAYIGTGAVLREGSRDKPLVIGAGAMVGMGAVVTKDVLPGAVVYGNPARPRGTPPA